MRGLILLLSAVASVACDGSGPFVDPNDVVIDPNDVVIDRTYDLVECTNPAGPGAAPCEVLFAASGRTYVDSAWVRLGPGHSAEWMLGAHRYVCPCYLSGCSTPCSHLAGTVEQRSASYTISNGVLMVGSLFRADVPSRVRSDWPGPDVLNLHYCGLCTGVVIRPN
jgi:hypothetical protein